MKSLFLFAVVVLVSSCGFCAQMFNWSLPSPEKVSVVVCDAAPQYREVRGDCEQLIWPTEPVGSPATPFRVVNFAVPDGADPSKAQISCQIEWMDAATGITLAPVQVAMSTDVEDRPFTPPDRAAYAEPVWPVADYVEADAYTASAVTILPVRVNTVRYLPRARRLEVAKAVQLAVTFPDVEEGEPRVIRPGRVNLELMRDALGVTVNGEEFTIVEAPVRSVQKSVGAAVDGVTPVKSVSFAAGDDKVDMVIISPPDFCSLWQMYVDYRAKTHPNMRIIIKNTMEIYTEFDGCDEAQKIHKYIEQLYWNNSLQYVLLGAYPPPNSGRDISTVSALKPNCQVPTRYAQPVNDHATDLYYACMDKPGNRGEVWDADNDGLFMRTRSGADTKANCDLVADLVVFRMPLRPLIVHSSGNNSSRTLTAEQVMIGFTNKLARAEKADFAGRNKYFCSGASLFSYFPKGDSSPRVVTERNFFDGGYNFFDKAMPIPGYEHLNIPRYTVWEMFTRKRSLQEVKWDSPPYSTITTSSYFARDCELSGTFGHGAPTGAANWLSNLAFGQTGLHKIHAAPIPCLTGFMDYGQKDITGVNNTLCAGEADVVNNIGGTCATIANTREGWWAGYSTLSGRIDELVNGYLCGYYGSGEALDVGKALLMTRQSFGRGLGALTGGGPKSLYAANGFGDPLVTLAPQYSRVWAGGSGGEYEWCESAADWTVSAVDAVVPATVSQPGRIGFDNGRALQVAVSEDTVFNISPVAGCVDFSLSAPESTITLTGSGHFRTFNSANVNVNTLVWNVAGGCGHSGLRFTGSEPGVLRLEGTAQRYFGTEVSNIRRVEWPGSNVIFDLGNTSTWTCADRLLEVTGRNNRIRNYAGTKAIFRSDDRIVIRDGGELVFETWNMCGTGTYPADDVLFYVTNGVMAIDVNPRWQYECLNRGVVLHNGSLQPRTDRFAFGNTARAGLTLWLSGATNSISGSEQYRVNGRLTLDLSSDTVLDVTGGFANGTSNTAGDVLLRGAGTVRVNGTSTTTGTITIGDGTRLVARTAAALGCGSVEVEDGGVLELDAFTLVGTRRLHVKSGASLILNNADDSGFYQLLDENGTELIIDEGASVYRGSEPGRRLNGIATSTSVYMIADSILYWRGQNEADASGSWAVNSDVRSFRKGGEPIAYADTAMVMFSDIDGVDNATVSVDSVVSPAFLDFPARSTYYTFNGSGAIVYPGLTLNGNMTFNSSVRSPDTISVNGGDMVFNGQLQAAQSIVLNGGRASIRNPVAESLVVNSGAELHLTGTYTTAEVAPRLIRFVFLENLSAENPAFQCISFYNGSGGKLAYPNPTTVRDWTGASATRTYYSSAGYLMGNGTGVGALISGVYQGNVTHQNLSFIGIGDIYANIYPNLNNTYARTNFKWAPSSTASPKYVDIELGTALGVNWGYRFHTIASNAGNPKVWQVWLKENAADEWRFYNQVTQTVTSTYSAYPIQYVNMGIPHWTSVELNAGSILALDGTFENVINVHGDVTFRALPDLALSLSGNYASLNFDSDTRIDIDVSALGEITAPQKIICGASFTSDDISRFSCSRMGAVLAIDSDGDLTVVTDGVAMPPYSRTLIDASESWNGTPGVWHASGSPMDSAWNDAVIDYKGDLTLTISRDAPQSITLDATGSNVHVTRLIVDQELPDAEYDLTIRSDIGVFAASEFDFTAFRGTLHFEAPLNQIARTSVRVGGGTYYFPQACTGSISVEDIFGVVHANNFVLGSPRNDGWIYLDQRPTAEPICELKFESWRGNYTIAKTVAAVSTAGTNGVINLANGSTLRIASGADITVGNHLWTATSPLDDRIEQMGGALRCVGAHALKPYLLGVTRMTTRHDMGGDALLEVPYGSADIGDRNVDNGYGELVLRDSSRSYMAAFCLSKGLIHVHPDATFVFGGASTSSSGSSGYLDGEFVCAGTIGAWLNNPCFNAPVRIDLPDTFEDRSVPCVAKFDANGKTLTFTHTISGSGSIVLTNSAVNAAGSVVLSGNNTFSGELVVATNTVLSVAGNSSFGVGGTRLAGGILELGSLRGATAQLAADSIGTVRVALSAEECSADVPLLSVADGVEIIPEGVNFSITIGGRSMVGRPVRLADGMIYLDSAAAIVPPVSAIIPESGAVWSALTWTDATGRQLAAVDWSVVTDASIVCPASGATLEIDCAVRTASVRFSGTGAVTVSGNALLVDRIDFSQAAAGSVCATPIDADTEVISGRQMSFAGEVAGTLRVASGSRAILARAPALGAVIDNKGTVEYAFPVSEIVPAASGAVNVYSQGTAEGCIATIEPTATGTAELANGLFSMDGLESAATLHVSGGTLEIGEAGACGSGRIVLAGGSLTAVATGECSIPIVVESAGFIGALPGQTLTVSGAVAGTGLLTIGSSIYSGRVVFTEVPQVPVLVAGGSFAPRVVLSHAVSVESGAVLDLEDSNNSGYIHVTDGTLAISSGATILIGGEPMDSSWRQNGGVFRQGKWLTRVGDGLWSESKWRNSAGVIDEFPVSTAAQLSVELLESNVSHIVVDCSATMYEIFFGGEIRLEWRDGMRLTLEGTRGFDVEGHVTLDLKDVRTPGLIVEGVLDPSEVTILGLADGLCVEVRENGIEVLDVSAIAVRPALWYYGSFASNALSHRGKSLSLGGATLVDGGIGARVGARALSISGVGDWAYGTSIATASNAVPAVSTDCSILAMSCQIIGSSFYEDLVGLRFRAQSASPNYYFTYLRGAWTSGDSGVEADPADTALHTYGLSYTSESGNSRGTTAWKDGAFMCYKSGLVSSNSRIVNLAFGGQITSGSEAPLSGAVFTSVMAFSNLLSSAEMRVWGAPRQTVRAVSSVMPRHAGHSRLLALDGSSVAIGERVEAFAARAVSSGSTITWRDGGVLRVGLGGADLTLARTLDLSKLSFWDADEHILIEGPYELSSNVEVRQGSLACRIVREPVLLKVVNDGTYYGTITNGIAIWPDRSGIQDGGTAPTSGKVCLRTEVADPVLVFAGETTLESLSLFGDGHFTLRAEDGAQVSITTLDLTLFTGTLTFDGVGGDWTILTASDGSVLDTMGEEVVFGGSITGGGMRVVGGGSLVVTPQTQVSAPITVADDTAFVIDLSGVSGIQSWNSNYPATRVLVRRSDEDIGFNNTTLFTWSSMPSASIVLVNDDGGRYTLTKLSTGLRLEPTIGSSVYISLGGSGSAVVELSENTQWHGGRDISYTWKELLDRGYKGSFEISGAGHVVARLTDNGKLWLSDTRALDSLSVRNSEAAHFKLVYNGSLEMVTNTLGFTSVSALELASNVCVRSSSVSSTAKIYGDGVVLYNGALPSASNGFSDSQFWRGTVRIENIAASSNLKVINSAYANTNSVVEYNNVAGYGEVSGSPEYPCREVRVGAGGWHFYSGTSGGGASMVWHTWSGALTGVGDIDITDLNGKTSAFNFRHVFQGGGLDYSGAITIPSNAQGSNFHIAFGDKPAVWNNISIYIAPGSAARIAAGKTWRAAYSSRYMTVGGLLVADGAFEGSLQLLDGAMLDLSGRSSEFVLTAAPQLPPGGAVSLRIDASMLDVAQRVRVMGWPAASPAVCSVQIDAENMIEGYMPEAVVESDGVYVFCHRTFDGSEYIDDSAVVAQELVLTAPTCSILLVDPSLRTVDNRATEVCLDIAQLGEDVYESGEYAIAFTDISRVGVIGTRDGWWSALTADGLEFYRVLTLTGFEGESITGSAPVRLDLSQLPEESYTSGFHSISIANPSKVRIVALRPGWWPTVTSTGIRFESTADLDMPVAWWIGDFRGGLIKADMQLTPGDSLGIGGGRALRIVGSGIRVDNIDNLLSCTLVATVENIKADATSDRNLMVFGGNQNSTKWVDLVGVRLRPLATSPNFWMTWNQSPWSSGNTSVARPSNLTASHTYALGFCGTPNGGDPLRGTHLYLDGSRIWNSSGLAASNMRVGNATFGAQRVSNNAIPAEGADFTSIMVFDKVLTTDLEKRIWTTSHPAVYSETASLPSSVLALTGAENTLHGRVQAFAVKAPVEESLLVFNQGATIIVGPGGFRNEDAPLRLRYDGNKFKAVTLIEGQILDPDTITYDGPLPHGCTFQVDSFGARLIPPSVHPITLIIR